MMAVVLTAWRVERDGGKLG
jgi:hypothetical protein